MIAQQSAAMTEARPGAARALPPTPTPTHWQGLRQRFDTLALRPPATSPDDAALARRDPACRAAVLAWCRQGAGPGGTPFWQPGGWPRVDHRLAVGALQGSTDSVSSAWVDHVARQLDGNLHLDALPGRAAGLAYRLGVKWHDAMWWRQRQADDPWDAGWALNTPAALHQLQTAFWPRCGGGRPTSGTRCAGCGWAAKVRCGRWRLASAHSVR